MNGLQAATCKAIVRVFETGVAKGQYGAVSAVKGDAGGVSYGVCQFSRASGNLWELVRAYRDAGGQFVDELMAWGPRLRRKATELDEDVSFHRALRRAGEDPVMQRVQEEFFDRRFWAPAARAADGLGLTLPLALAVMLDSTVHGNRDGCVGLTTACVGTVEAVGERPWTSEYLRQRRCWLWGKGGLLRKTVYRVDALLELAALDRWMLSLPLDVPGRGVVIKESDLRF